MKTLLICHEDDELNRVGLARWLSSFSDLVGIVSLRETRARKWKRVRRELQRVGPLRFLDVLAFRLYYRLLLAQKDKAWEAELLQTLRRTYPELAPGTPELITASPSSPEAEAFIKRQGPDVMVARCKTLLARRIFTLPSVGTFVMHPGVCPEYRNAHGCFWALANDDRPKVGMTLLKIDQGVDTGPIYGYYSCRYDERAESHITIQHRTVFDNLDVLREDLLRIGKGGGTALDVAGRPSAAWGQPWLTRYLRWKRRARSRPAA
jgi:formyl transferase-like protein